MSDQAQGLRQLVRHDPSPGRDSHGAAPMVIAVTAGKGGVGTTTLAVNLAVALSTGGRGTVLVDADSNRADVSVLCQLDQNDFPDQPTVGGGLRSALRAGPGRVQVLSSTWPSLERSDMGPREPVRLLDSLRRLGPAVEFIVIDIGNGVHQVIREFWQSADALLLVSSPDPVALVNSYAAVKLLATDRMATPIYSIMNLADDLRPAADAQRRLSDTCRRFLRIELIESGQVPLDQHVAASCRVQHPFVLRSPDCAASASVRWLAEFLAASRQNLFNPAA